MLNIFWIIFFRADLVVKNWVSKLFIICAQQQIQIKLQRDPQKPIHNKTHSKKVIQINLSHYSLLIDILHEYIGHEIRKSNFEKTSQWYNFILQYGTVTVHMFFWIKKYKTWIIIVYSSIGLFCTRNWILKVHFFWN